MEHILESAFLKRSIHLNDSNFAAKWRKSNRYFVGFIEIEFKALGLGGQQYPRGYGGYSVNPYAGSYGGVGGVALDPVYSNGFGSEYGSRYNPISNKNVWLNVDNSISSIIISNVTDIAVHHIHHWTVHITIDMEVTTTDIMADLAVDMQADLETTMEAAAVSNIRIP